MRWLTTVNKTFIQTASAFGLVVALAATGIAQAKFTKLHDFSGADGAKPVFIAVSGSTVFGTAT